MTCRKPQIYEIVTSSTYVHNSRTHRRQRLQPQVHLTSFRQLWTLKWPSAQRLQFVLLPALCSTLRTNIHLLSSCSCSNGRDTYKPGCMLSGSHREYLNLDPLIQRFLLSAGTELALRKYVGNGSPEVDCVAHRGRSLSWEI